jgi:hypothetical protein
MAVALKPLFACGRWLRPLPTTRPLPAPDVRLQRAMAEEQDPSSTCRHVPAWVQREGASLACRRAAQAGQRLVTVTLL